MILLTPAPLAWIIAAAGVLGGAMLCRQEWGRPNQRRRSARLAATALAVGLLTLWGLRPGWRVTAPAAGRIEAALWTDGDGAAPESVSSARRFALPGAALAGKQAVPDAAFLWRQFPEIGTLHLVGKGLEADNLETLRGLRLIFHEGAGPAQPGVCFLFCPRQAAAGEPFVIQGSIDGLQNGQRVAVALEDPAGAVSEAPPLSVDGSRARFEVASMAAAAPGRFVWRLRLKEPGEGGRTLAEEPIGVSVTPPALPRVR